MKKSTINKTVITYKKIAKNKKNLDEVWLDGWLICCSEDDGWIVYKKIIRKVEKILTEHEDAFEKFWKKYPKKIGKTSVEKKIMLLDKDEIEPMLAWLDAYLICWDADIKKKNLQFIPNPETWINNKRWQDEIELPIEKINTINIDKQRVENKKLDILEEARKQNEARRTKAIKIKIEELKKSDPDIIKNLEDDIEKALSSKIVWVYRIKAKELQLRVKVWEIYYPKK